MSVVCVLRICCSVCTAVIKLQLANAYQPIVNTYMSFWFMCITQLIYSASNKRIYVVFLLRECLHTFLILVKSKCNLQERERRRKNEKTHTHTHTLPSRRTNGLTDRENNKYSLCITIRSWLCVQCSLRIGQFEQVRFTRTTATRN